jgi:hypothetical protein
MMIDWLDIVVAVIAVLVVVMLLPPFIFQRKLKHANGTNNALWIVMDPDAANYDCVLAQEVYECLFRKNPVNMFYVEFTRRGQRKMEIRGHEVEVQTYAILNKKTPKQVEQYRATEAHGMSNHYDCFKGMSVNEIITQMESESARCKTWVERVFIPEYYNHK